MKHALKVGSAKAAAFGTNSEDKTVRQQKTHTHKLIYNKHSKKMH